MKRKKVLAAGLIAVLMTSSVSVYAEDYVVQPGDYLVKIADKYNTTWRKLAEYNKLKDATLIYPGQVIKIPETQTVTKPATNTNTTTNTTTTTKPEVTTETKVEEKVTNKLVRTTKAGAVKGFEKNGNLVWTGVPYAKAERWEAPVSPDKWTGEFDATKPGTLGIQLQSGKIVGAEDCLNLDIYRPDNNDTNLPVLIYIHGGNNQTGTSTEISGATLAKEANAVVISINYRLGILGFNALPSIDDGTAEENSGNFTLLDIAKALDWVNENVEAFGGNKDNVTISGFSAGGRDVTAIMMSPMFKGKFDKAISFSGGITVADEAASINNIAKAVAPLVVQDGVKKTEAEAYEWLKTSDKAVAEYLRGVSAERLAALMPNAGIRMSAFPHLYNDGVVLPKDATNATYYNDVPFMMVTGVGEFSFFGNYSPYFMSPDFKAKPADVQAAEIEFMQNYGGLLYKYANAQATAEVMESKLKSNMYIMEIELGEGAEEWGPVINSVGAYHGVFVPFIDLENTSYTANFGEPYKSVGGQELGEDFRAYLKNYLWSSNPNGQDLVEWKPWEEATRQSIVLGGSMKDGVIELKDQSISYEEVLKQMDADKTISEEAKAKIISEVLNGRWFSGPLDEYYGNKDLWVK